MAKNRYVILSAFTASLGGLLFGFDTAVISGAEKTIQQIFSLNGFWHGFTIAIALIGTLFGALFAGRPADILGRKRLLFIIAVLYTISALGSAMAGSWISFLIYRFIGGLGVGASSVIGPMYIAEIAPARLRGRLVTAFQLNIVFGILLSYFSNYLINSVIEFNAWRWMLGVEAIPAIVFIGLIFFIPESPRWLVLKNKVDEAISVFSGTGSIDPKQDVLQVQESVSNQLHGKKEKIFSIRFRKPVMLAFLVAVFNQLSGINAIMYYAPRIFEMVGYAQQSALLQSISIGITLFIFTIVGMVLVDKVGRKKLLIVGAIGMVIFLSLVSYTILNSSNGSIWILIYLAGFITFFAFSQGTVIWVYISEIFPNSVRAKGQSLGSFTHWAMAAIISWLFPVIAELNQQGGAMAFLIFSVAMLIQLIVVYYLFPETKGRSLEDIQKNLFEKNK